MSFLKYHSENCLCLKKFLISSILFDHNIFSKNHSNPKSFNTEKLGKMLSNFIYSRVRKSTQSAKSAYLSDIRLSPLFLFHSNYISYNNPKTGYIEIQINAINVIKPV